MRTESVTEYDPDYVFPPGVTLLETIEALGMSQAELAERLGVSSERYELEIPDGPTVWTKVSHGTGELSKSLEGEIARQLKVRTTFFRGMMDCHNSCEDYCQKVRATPFSPGG